MLFNLHYSLTCTKSCLLFVWQIVLIVFEIQTHTKHKSIFGYRNWLKVNENYD